MSELYETITQLCVQKGINITELCRQSGASRGSLSDLKMGRKNSLSASTLSKIAEFFDVPVDYLLGTYTKKRGKSVPTDNPNDRYPYLLGKKLDGIITVEESDELQYLEQLNQIAEDFENLNAEGRQKAIERVAELTEIPKYHR